MDTEVVTMSNSDKHFNALLQTVLLFHDAVFESRIELNSELPYVF